MESSLQIQNLKCGGCAHTIVTQLSKLAGIAEVKVNNETNEVRFNYDSDPQIEMVKKKLSDLGYPVVGVSNSLPKKAKSFVSCAIGRLNQ